MPCKSTVDSLLKIVQELTELVNKSPIMLANNNNVRSAATEKHREILFHQIPDLTVPEFKPESSPRARNKSSLPMVETVQLVSRVQENSILVTD